MAGQESYIIRLSGLRKESQTFDYQLSDGFFGQLDQDEILGGAVRATVTIIPVGDAFRMQLQVAGCVKIICDRCLDEMEQAVEAADEMIVKIGRGEDEDGIVYADAQTGELDLSWLLYELIETNLPIVHCHQAGGCNPQMEELLQAHLCTEEEPEV